jgi:hypothetical protein
VTKLPQPPGVVALGQIEPEILTLSPEVNLARIYFAGGLYPSRWNQFRRVGPAAARWDHHVLSPNGDVTEQTRAILYCAPDVDTCAAEVFQATRRIDRTRDAPALVVFALRERVRLLNLHGTFATKIGASTAINSGPRARVRAWARELYDAYPHVQGIYYGSSMNGHAPAIALNERAQRAMPALPLFHRALNDDMLVDTLQRIALRLAYGLR